MKPISDLKNKWRSRAAMSTDVGERLRLTHFIERGLSRSDRIELVIDPGPSFGAGDHPTTVMALEFLEDAVARSSEGTFKPAMLDVGTGTGVLAIAGKALGTGFTVGLDIDPVAVVMARRNLVLNMQLVQERDPQSGAAFFVGGPDALRGRFHIVAANLVAPVLLGMRGDLTARTGRLLILSGIIDPMKDGVITQFLRGPLELVGHKQLQGWNACLFECNGSYPGEVCF